MRPTLSFALITAMTLPSLAFGDIPRANARAKAGDFDASGEVRCAQEVGQSLGACAAEVARADGSAVVVVTFPNGFSRILMFGDARFLRGNATMSGVGTDADWTLSDGVYRVRVDDQRFELPEALVFGD